MLYNTMIDTADTIYDPVTGANYHRLNLDRAIESIMPADDFGSTAATAEGLGTIVDARSLTGTIGKLGDQDWFSFQAGVSGKVTLSAAAAGEIAPQWEFAIAPADLVASGSTVTFAVVAGQTYRVGLSTDAGLGHYTLDLHLEPIRVIAPFRQVGKELRVSGTAGDDAFALVVADTYRLSVNGVEYQFDRQAVNSFVFDGSTGRDTILLQAATGGATAVLQPGSVDLGGLGYTIHAGSVECITVRAGSGSNRVTFYDSPGDDKFTATSAFAELSGPGFVNRAEGFSSVSALASGGIDVAWLYDSPGSDTLAVGPTETTLSGRGFSNRARFFDEIYASGEAGGYDLAVLYNSAGNMQLDAAGRKAEARFTTLAADGTLAESSKTSLSGFEHVRALSYGGKAIRPKLAAVDFVLELIDLQA